MILPLPILVADQQVLSPPLNYVFDRRWLDPFESIVSILWKFAYLNGVTGHALAGRICARGIDPYEGVVPAREAVQWRWLHRDHQLPRRALRESMVASSRVRALHPHLRYCGRCLSRGYHATIHQFVGLVRCPIHDLPLASACRCCQFEIPLRLNALLLDAPFACPNCRTLLMASRPSITRRRPMRMAELVKMTRARVGLRLA